MSMIKRLCLANGDEYNDVQLNITEAELVEIMREGEFVFFETDKKKVYINASFVVSFELGERVKDMSYLKCVPVLD